MLPISSMKYALLNLIPIVGMDQISNTNGNKTATATWKKEQLTLLVRK